MKRILGLFLWLFAASFPAAAQEIFEHNGKFGIKNGEGHIVVPADYFQIMPLKNGSFLTCKAHGHVAAEKHDPTQADRVILETWASLQKFPYQQALRYGHITKDLKLGAHATYKELYIMPGDRFLQAYDGTIYHLLDLQHHGKDDKHRWSEEFIWYINPSNDVYMRFKQKDKYGLLGVFTYSYRISLKPVYDRVVSIDTVNDYLLIQSASEQLLQGPEGGALKLKRIYDKVEVYGGSSYARVSMKGKYGLIEMYDEAEEVVPLQYDGIEYSSEGNFVLLQSRGKWGLADIDAYIESGGKQLALPIEYDEIDYSNADYIRARKGEDWRRFFTMDSRWEEE